MRVINGTAHAATDHRRAPGALPQPAMPRDAASRYPKPQMIPTYRAHSSEDCILTQSFICHLDARLPAAASRTAGCPTSLVLEADHPGLVERQPPRPDGADSTRGKACRAVRRIRARDRRETRRGFGQVARLEARQRFGRARSSRSSCGSPRRPRTSTTRSGWRRPTSRKAPSGRVTISSSPSTRPAAARMRVPSCLFRLSSRAAVLTLSPTTL